MVVQVYIRSQSHNMMAVIKKPDILVTKKIAILVSSLFSPMCDCDYFMSHLSNCLYNKGIRTVQVDLLGHGDSDLDISEMSFALLSENIKIVSKYVENQFGEKTVIISRGIMAQIIMRSINNAVYAINPPMKLYDGMVKKINIEPYTINKNYVQPSKVFNDLYLQGYDMYSYFGLGRNDCTQLISIDLFKEIFSVSEEYNYKKIYFPTLHHKKVFFDSIQQEDGYKLFPYNPIVQIYTRLQIASDLTNVEEEI